MMTKKLLESYQSKKEEIIELEYKLQHLGEGDTMVGNSTVFDYRSGYPVPQAVVGVDRDKFYERKEHYTNLKDELKKECQEVEDFIENITDSLTRRIFRMYYMESMSQKAIADNVHLDRSRISRKIDEYMKNAHKAHKAQL